MLCMASVGKNPSKCFLEFDSFLSISCDRYFHYLQCRCEETGVHGSFLMASVEKLVNVQVRI